MKRAIGILLAVVMVLAFATACGSGEKTTTTADRSMEQNQGGSGSSDAGTTNAQGTTEQQGVGVTTTMAQQATTPNPNLEAYGKSGEELSGDKMGYVTPEWTELFGAEKLAKSSNSGIVYTLGGYQEGMKPYTDMYERKHEGAAWYALPQLNLDTDDAKNFNANMQAYANALLLKNEERQENQYVGDIEGINYVVYEHGNFVSIVLLYRGLEGRVDVRESVSAVVYDKTLGRFISWSEIMEAAGVKKADVAGLEKWFVSRDLYSENTQEFGLGQDGIKHNYLEDAAKVMFFVGSRIYDSKEMQSGLYTSETVIRRTIFEPMFNTFYYPEASLYIDDEGRLMIAGSHLELERNVADFYGLDVPRQKIKVASVQDALKEVQAFEQQDDSVSELYAAFAKKAGVNPADGPNAYVVKLGIAVQPLSTEDNRKDEDKPEPVFQGVQDVLKTVNPNGSLAQHVSDEIPIPFSMTGEKEFPLYLVIPKNKWNAVVVGDPQQYTSFISLGASLVSTGGTNASITLFDKSENLGTIAIDEDRFLKFGDTKDFVDATQFVTPNPELEPESQYLLQYFTPLVIPGM